MKCETHKCVREFIDECTAVVNAETIIQRGVELGITDGIAGLKERDAAFAYLKKRWPEVKEISRFDDEHPMSLMVKAGFSIMDRIFAQRPYPKNILN